MQHYENAPGTGIVRGGGGDLLDGNITSDNIILAARKTFASRLSRDLGLSGTMARLTVDMALGGAHV
jgi:hypothetical protein